MKLRHQFYLFQILLFFILFLFLGFTYSSYEDQYTKDIDKQIQNELEIHKKQILTSFTNATENFDKQREYFENIHLDTLNLLKKNSNIDLDKLKSDIKSKYLSSRVDVELYLIDKSYTIYNTTYPKDLGFNLSIVTEAKNYLDKTKKDEKIYISDFVSTDALDMKYKLYSYSKLKEGIYFEMGFVDNTLTNLMEKFMDNSKLTLYNVSKDDKQYYYYAMKKRDDNLLKEQHYKKFYKFSLTENTKDHVINSVKKNQEIHLLENNIHTVYSKIFENRAFETLGFENIVMKLDVDVSDKLAFIHTLKMVLMIAIILVLVIFVIVFIFIKEKFTNPIERILLSLNMQKKVEDKNVLLLNNELSDISIKYNNLFDNLNLEIDKNQFLLNENKQFIADTVHQIRTPLSNIMMNADMIKLYKKDVSLLSFIDQINGSINMLNNSYEDLSYIMTYDSIKYDPSILCLSDIVNNRVKFFETISKVNHKEIISEIDVGINFAINKIELERLIDNNISNGLKYAEIDKNIIIRLNKVNNGVVLVFETYGIELKHKSKLFEKSYRENSAKRGLGLGLYMVKNICEKYDIAYSVSYENGKNIFTYRFKK